MALKIGGLLVSMGLVSPDKVDQALEHQNTHGGRLGSILVGLGFVSDHDLARVLSEQLHLPAAKYDEFKAISESAIRAMSADFVKEHQCIPLVLRHRIRVAIADPWEIKAINEWGLQNSLQVQMVLAPEIWIIAAMERYYRITRPDRFNAAESAETLPGDENKGSRPAEVIANNTISFPVFQKQLAESRSKEEIFDVLLNYLAPILPQIAVFVLRKGFAVGWLVHGLPVRPSVFGKIEIPLSVATSLATVVNSREPFQGIIAQDAATRMRFDLLQIDPGQQIRLCPIVFRGQVATVLLGIPNQPLSSDQEKVVFQACGKMEAAIEMLVYRKIILAPFLE
ncbi:MAG: hypothetical protein V1495_10480 [Pseudomonadota bacterium]